MSLSVWEKLGYLPVVVSMVYVAIYAALSAPFRGADEPKKFANHVVLSVSRTAFTRLSVRQRQYLAGTTEGHYLSWTRSKKLKPETDVLEDGTKLFWIGRSTADYVVLYFHGGGWSMPGNTGHFEFAVSTISKAEKKGKSIAFAVVQYGLAPAARYPSQLSQCVEALDYLLHTVGKPPSKILLAGDSAGGTLALGVLAAVIFSPWVNLEMHGTSVQKNRLQDPVTPEVMRDWTREYLHNLPLDNYNQPVLAPADWWRGLPVGNVFISGASKEMLADDLRTFSETIKSVHPSTTVFLSASDFHAQPVLGPEMGLGDGEQGPVIKDWIVMQLDG